MQSSEVTHKPRNLIYWLGGLALLALGIGLWGFYLLPRAEEIPVYCGHGECQGYYRGLGWHSGEGYLGKNWFYLRAEVAYLWCGTILKGDISDSDLVSFQSHYPDGELQSKGTCRLVQEAVSTGPVLHPQRIQDAKYFDKADNLLSVVIEGTGVRTHTDERGRLIYQCAMRQGMPVSIRIFEAAKEAKSYRACGENYEDRGPYMSNRDDGSLKTAGRKGLGATVGFRFYPDGSVADFTRPDDRKTKWQKFEPGERSLTLEEQAEIEEIEAELLAPFKNDSLLE